MPQVDHVRTGTNDFIVLSFENLILLNDLWKRIILLKSSKALSSAMTFWINTFEKPRTISLEDKQWSNSWTCPNIKKKSFQRLIFLNMINSSLTLIQCHLKIQRMWFKRNCQIRLCLWKDFVDNSWWTFTDSEFWSQVEWTS